MQYQVDCRGLTGYCIDGMRGVELGSIRGTAKLDFLNPKLA